MAFNSDKRSWGFHVRVFILLSSLFADTTSNLLTNSAYKSPEPNFLASTSLASFEDVNSTSISNFTTVLPETSSIQQSSPQSNSIQSTLNWSSTTPEFDKTIFTSTQPPAVLIANQTDEEIDYERFAPQLIHNISIKDVKPSDVNTPEVNLTTVSSVLKNESLDTIKQNEEQLNDTGQLSLGKVETKELEMHRNESKFNKSSNQLELSETNKTVMDISNNTDSNIPISNTTIVALPSEISPSDLQVIEPSTQIENGSKQVEEFTKTYPDNVKHVQGLDQNGSIPVTKNASDESVMEGKDSLDNHDETFASNETSRGNITGVGVRATVSVSLLVTRPQNYTQDITSNIQNLETNRIQDYKSKQKPTSERDGKSIRENGQESGNSILDHLGDSDFDNLTTSDSNSSEGSLNVTTSMETFGNNTPVTYKFENDTILVTVSTVVSLDNSTNLKYTSTTYKPSSTEESKFTVRTDQPTTQRTTTFNTTPTPTSATSSLAPRTTSSTTYTTSFSTEIVQSSTNQSFVPSVSAIGSSAQPSYSTEDANYMTTEEAEEETVVPIVSDISVVRVAGVVRITGGLLWMAQLTDRNSPEYKELAPRVQHMLEDLFLRTPLAYLLRAVEIDGFSEGSVIVDFFLVLMKTEQELRVRDIMELFNAQLDNYNMFMEYTFDPSSTEFEILSGKQEGIRPTEESSQEPPIPQWAIAVIVIGAASFIFIFLFAAVSIYGRHHVRRKYNNRFHDEDGERTVETQSNEWESKLSAAYENLAADGIYDLDDVAMEKKNRA